MTILQPAAEFPPEWRTIEFDNFTTLKRGKDLTKNEFRNGTVPVAGSNGVIGFHNIANVKGPGVTVGRSGSVGRVTYYEGDFWAHNTALFVTNFHGNDPRFAAYLLDFLRLGRFGSGVSVPTLDRNAFRSLPVTVPPLPEQKKIAHILSTVQRAIEEQERIIQTTTELKKALMQKLFTEGLRGEPQKETEIGLVPESWEVVELEKKSLLFQYGTSVKCGYGEGKPVLRIPNVVGGHIDPGDLKFGHPKKSELGSHKLQGGDLLFVRTNGVKKNAGRCSLFTGELEDCYFASYLIRVRVNPKKLNPAFLSEYSRTEVGTSFLSGRSIRTADGKFNINSETLKRMLVPAPMIEEQNEIANILVLVDKKVARAEEKCEKFQEVFRILLHKLMAAKIRVQTL